MFPIDTFFCVATITKSKTGQYSKHWFERYLCLMFIFHWYEYQNFSSIFPWYGMIDLKPVT